MDMKPCSSRQVREHGYDPEGKRLAVRFNDGRLFHYKGVEPELAAELAEAPSVGSFLSSRIKGQYEHSFVPEDEEK